jgi:hypothetical protein
MERLPTETRTCVGTRPATVSHHESVAILGKPWRAAGRVLGPGDIKPTRAIVEAAYGLGQAGECGERALTAKQALRRTAAAGHA